MIHRVERALRAARRALGRTALTVRLFAHAHDRGGDDGEDASAHRRGLVIVQIDGLSRVELERALARGELPTLARLVRRERYALHGLYSGLPSSTPAVQGELFYGVAGAVPAFAWIDREGGAIRRMYDPSSAARVERRLAASGPSADGPGGAGARAAPVRGADDARSRAALGEALLAGGSAYSNIYTGGAAEAHFCVASLGWSELLRDARPHAWLGVALLHLPTLARTVALAAWETLRALAEALGGIGDGQRAATELKFVAARVAVVVLLRDLITIGAKVDIARGLPVVHLNYLGYDEQAHRRGPDSAFAHHALAGIDRRIAALWKATHRATHRHYDLWVYGDHGQERTVPYAHRHGRSPEAALAAALEALGGERPASPRASVAPTGAVPPPATAGTAHLRARLLGGRHLVRLFPDGRGAPIRHDASDAATETAGENAVGGTRDGEARRGDATRAPRATLVGMGPVAHVRFARGSPATALVRARLAERLVEREGVPAALCHDARGAAIARVRGRWLALPAEAPRLLGAEHPALPDIADDLVALLAHPDAGEVVLLGWAAGRRAISFAEENGAHAGVGPNETLSFALLPEDALAAREDGAPLRPATLRGAALALLGRGGAARAARAAPPRAPHGAERRPAERRLRVMSYNVHGCLGMDGRLAPERIARVIARAAPDVVALQELDVARARSGRRDQAALIAEALAMEHRFHPAIRVEEEAYGDAILTRLPVLAARAAMLPGPRVRRGIEPRGALWLTLDLDGVALQVINTHLGLLPAERRLQVAELLTERWLAHPECRDPVILCGDLNATPCSAPLRRLTEQLADVRRAAPRGAALATFPGRRPGLAIDHVLTRGALRVERVAVPASELERVASDHLPLVVELVLGARVAPARAAAGEGSVATLA